MIIENPFISSSTTDDPEFLRNLAKAFDAQEDELIWLRKEVEAWRTKFFKHTYRRQDDCISLKLD